MSRTKDAKGAPLTIRVTVSALHSLGRTGPQYAVRLVELNSGMIEDIAAEKFAAALWLTA